ncbi:hypothetical protein SAMN04244570_2510 [Sporosarcina newyorkensis]|uniref:Uncharacterized protein n=1 Tax=Sporosarcina newyorkensis TaxID=759851 RepID=A0A1T4YFI4_9BACL|nr:hypothetical protein SAMN04244570_2510 [Sporosarcina newyorkensis]
MKTKTVAWFLQGLSFLTKDLASGYGTVDLRSRRTLSGGRGLSLLSWGSQGAR